MIFFCGQLPPPLHGFSSINLKMLKILENYETKSFNLAPNLDTRNLIIRFFLSLYKFLYFALEAVKCKPASLYIGLSGGIRQIVDALYIWVCMPLGTRCFVHHHSFAYLNRTPAFSKCILFTLRRCHHIVLCECMKNLLSSRYGIDPRHIDVISNAAFIEPKHVSRDPAKRGQGLALGFLSNITYEKGIREVFSIFKSVSTLVPNSKLLIAGPVNSEAQDWLDQQVSEHDNITYIGPVYDDQKRKFFEEIDVFLFPTNYVNEAEPMVILEAFSYGIPVIAKPRGCIGELLNIENGRLMSNSSSSLDSELDLRDWIIQLGQDSSLFSRTHKGAIRTFDKLHRDGQGAILKVIERMKK